MIIAEVVGLLAASIERLLLIVSNNNWAYDFVGKKKNGIGNSCFI